MMHGRIQKILSGGGGVGGGVGCPENSGSYSKHLDPRGPTSSRGCQ